MNGAFYIAGVGLDTQQGALDTLANNIANLNTHGFKRALVQFSELVNASARAAEAETVRAPSDMGLAGVALTTTMALGNQGDLERTDETLDLALEGAGFIEVLGENGQRMLWRGGRLQVNPDGFLAASNGMMLASQISIPDAATDLRIDGEGLVSALMDDGEFERIGDIDLLRVRSPEGLTRMDGGFYRVDDKSTVENAAASQEGMGTFVQGSLERSNVELNREMVEMMIVQRAYAANAQVVQAADQMSSIANNLRR